MISMRPEVEIIDTYFAIWREEPDETEVLLNFGRIIPGLGLCDDDGTPVCTFWGSTPADCWEAAFNASAWADFEPFYDRQRDQGHYPQTWNAIAPGRSTVARWFILVLPAYELEPPRRRELQPS